MNALKIIKDHNLAIRKLPLTRSATKTIWSNNTNHRKYMGTSRYEKTIKNADCWLCNEITTHTPTMHWNVYTDWDHPALTLEGSLEKFILHKYANDPKKQREYLDAHP